MMNTYLGVGGNENESLQTFQRLIKLLNKSPDIHVSKLSSLFKSRAWGVTEQNDFLNFVIQLNTELKPQELLRRILDLEIKLGRDRSNSVKWGPRLIDIDILLYGNMVIDEDSLKIPHPFITEREFVYIPLLELDPKIKIPKKGALSKLVSPKHDMKLIQTAIDEA